MAKLIENTTELTDVVRPARMPLASMANPPLPPPLPPAPPPPLSSFDNLSGVDGTVDDVDDAAHLKLLLDVVSMDVVLLRLRNASL